MAAGATEDGAVVVQDGRRLAYRAYGLADGIPVLHHHGTPGSRLAAFNASDLSSSGVRVIVADRPGFGRSDPHAAERPLSGWAGDAAQLADALGLDRFAVSGFSGGGPFALACAAGLGERITHTAVIAGAGQLADPAVASSLPAPFDEGVRLAREDPASLRAFLSATASADAVLGMITERATGPDRALYDDPDYLDEFRDAVEEAFRQGPGAYVDEFMLLMRPWDIDLSSIVTPVSLWYGEHDPNPLHQPDMGRLLAGQIRHARFTLVPGAGAELPRHPVVHDILKALTASPL